MKQTHFFSVLRVSLVLSKFKKHRDISVKVFYSDFDLKLKYRFYVIYKKAFVEYSEYYKSLEEAFDKTLSIDLALNHPTGSSIRKKQTAFLKARSKLSNLFYELPKMGIKDYRHFDWTEF